jgi:hypothetical protein
MCILSPHRISTASDRPGVFGRIRGSLAQPEAKRTIAPPFGDTPVLVEANFGSARVVLSSVFIGYINVLEILTKYIGQYRKQGMSIHRKPKGRSVETHPALAADSWRRRRARPASTSRSRSAG